MNSFSDKNIEKSGGDGDNYPEESGGAPELRVEQILSYFVSRTGLTNGEIVNNLGGIAEDFRLSPQEAVEKYFSADTKPIDFRRFLLSRYGKNINSGLLNGANSLGVFWQDLMVNLLHQEEWRFKYYDRWFDVVARNALVDVRLNQPRWNENLIPKLSESIATHSPEALALLIRDLKNNESIESRLKIAQSGLHKVQMLGRDILSQGKIPITRLLFFKGDDKLRFLEDVSHGERFSSRNSEILPTYYLSDVESHTQEQSPNTPLSSWTHEPASEPWRYGLSHIGRSSAVMLVSELGWDEVVWCRNLTENSTWYYPEEYRWYEKIDNRAPYLDHGSDLYLSTLQRDGKKAALVPTESEIVVWGETPVRGVVDFGP